MERLATNPLDRSRSATPPVGPIHLGGRGGFPAGLIAIGIAAAGMLSFLAFLATGDSRLLLLGLALTTSAVPFALAAADAPERLIHPLTLLGVSMTLGVAGQTGFLLFGASPIDEYALLSGVGEEGLTKGVLVVAAGTLALALGFIASAPRTQARPGRLLRRAVGSGLARPSVERMTLVVAALCMISIISFALYAPKVGIVGPADLLTSQKRFVEVAGESSPLGYYRFGISLAGTAFVLAAYTCAIWRLRLRSRLGILAMVALAIVVVSSFAVSSRSELLAPVAMAALVIISIRGREPSPQAVLAILVAGLLVVTLMAGLRAVGQNRTDSFDAAAGYGSIVEGPVASRDWMGIGPISAVVSRVPDRYDYQYGKTLASVLWAPIPRSVWPEKPPVRLGPEIAPAVYEFSYQRRSGDPPGVLGEFWLNGGLIAVVIGMAIFGAVLRRVERWNRLAPETEGLSALLYGILAVELALRLPKSDVTGIVLSIIGLLVPATVALWVCRARAGSPEPGTAGLKPSPAGTSGG